jgi:hypothetical protein
MPESIHCQPKSTHCLHPLSRWVLRGFDVRISILIYGQQLEADARKGYRFGHPPSARKWGTTILSTVSLHDLR